MLHRSDLPQGTVPHRAVLGEHCPDFRVVGVFDVIEVYRLVRDGRYLGGRLFLNRLLLRTEPVLGGLGAFFKPLLLDCCRSFCIILDGTENVGDDKRGLHHCCWLVRR